MSVTLPVIMVIIAVSLVRRRHTTVAMCLAFAMVMIVRLGQGRYA